MDINNPEDRKKWKAFVNDAIDSLTKEQAEKDHRKQIAEDVKEELDVDKAQFNRTCSAIFKDNLDKKVQETEEIQNLVEAAK
tara:strand:- start:751 stop:996 length:246 start_codon:yes stop_codon:yes gene_type:complete